MVLKRRTEEYVAVIGRVYAAAFGPFAGDRFVAAAARAYVNYSPLHDLRDSGLSLDEAIEVVADSLIAIVDRQRRLMASRNPGQGVEG